MKQKQSDTHIHTHTHTHTHTYTQREKMAMGVKNAPLTLVAHVLGLAAAVMVLVWCIHFRGGLAWEASNKSLIFNLHPVVVLIGLIIIGGEAIMSYKSLPLKKEVKKQIHLVLHAIALTLGIVGIYAAFKFHNDSGIANLYSLHSWLGIGIITIYAIQWIYGFVTFFYPGGSAAIRRESLPWHVLIGLFVYVLAVGNAALGFLEKLTFLENFGLAKYSSEAFLVNFTAIVTILYGASVLLAVRPQARVEDGHSYSPLLE
ncbi:probable ascorbate-specific transmembrane electron transporter 1 [Cornus florida]|uniref:probable ascorbate-specific transmembrane electron transporter 1 n=1 Tax=Cornus florida TaxID=4283 RepID=UPI00289EC9EC|nr:probable ascorbate-specific transmembrane electron transporter 1 [Cornus florida]